MDALAVEGGDAGPYRMSWSIPDRAAAANGRGRTVSGRGARARGGLSETPRASYGT
jgi:hypothetical protein